MRPLIKTVAKKTVFVTMMFLFAVGVSTASAQGRGGGHQAGGGGHSGRGPSAHFSGSPRGHFDGGHGFRGRRGVIIRGGFYDPFFWGPYPYWGWGYPYPYEAYPYDLTPSGSVKTDVTPKQTEVYVDGYYAGVADSFDGAFKRLHTSPGGHTFSLRLEGYRTVSQNIYVRPDSTYKLSEAMEKLAPGEVSAPVPAPTRPAGRSDRMTPKPPDGSSPQR